MKNNYNNPLGHTEGEDRTFKATFQVKETVIKDKQIKQVSVAIKASYIALIDAEGNLLETKNNEQYIVKIRDGEISFNKPLIFINNDQKT